MPPKTNAKVQKQNVTASKDVSKATQEKKKGGSTQERSQSPKTTTTDDTTNMLLPNSSVSPAAATTATISSSLLLRSVLFCGEENNTDLCNYGGGGGVVRVVQKETSESGNDNDLMSSTSTSFDSPWYALTENDIVASVPSLMMPTHVQTRFLEANNRAARTFLLSSKLGEDTTTDSDDSNVREESQEKTKRSEHVTELLMKSISDAESSLRLELATLFANRVKNTANVDPFSQQLLSHVSLLFGTRQTFKEVLRHSGRPQRSCADMHAPQSGSTIATNSSDTMPMAGGAQDGKDTEDDSAAFEALAVADPDFVLAQFEHALPKRLFCSERRRVSLGEKRTTEKRRRQASLHMSARRPTVAPSASFPSPSAFTLASASVSPALIRSRTNGDGGRAGASEQKRALKGGEGLTISKKKSDDNGSSTSSDSESVDGTTAVRTESGGKESNNVNIQGRSNNSTPAAFVQLLTLGDGLSRIRDALPPYPIVKNKVNADIFSSGDGSTSDVCVDRRQSKVAVFASPSNHPRVECTDEEEGPKRLSYPSNQKLTTASAAPLGLGGAESLKKLITPAEVASSISERVAALLLVFSHRLVGLFDYTVANEAEAHRLAMMRSKHGRKHSVNTTCPQQHNSGCKKEKGSSRGAALPAESVFFSPEIDGSCEEEVNNDVDNKDAIEQRETNTTVSLAFTPAFASQKENKEQNDKAMMVDKNCNKICSDLGEDMSSVPTSSSYLSFAPTFVEEWLELVDSLCPELASPLGALSGIFSYVFAQIVTAQHRVLTTRVDQNVVQRLNAQIQKVQSEVRTVRVERDALRAEVDALRRERERNSEEEEMLEGSAVTTNSNDGKLCPKESRADDKANAIGGGEEKERRDSKGRGVGVGGHATEKGEEGVIDRNAPHSGKSLNRPDSLLLISDDRESLTGEQGRQQLANGVSTTTDEPDAVQPKEGPANAARANTTSLPLDADLKDPAVVDLLARQQHVIDELRRALSSGKRDGRNDSQYVGVSTLRSPIIDVLRSDDKAVQTDNGAEGKCPQCLKRRKRRKGAREGGAQRRLRGEDDGSGYIFFDQTRNPLEATSVQHAQAHKKGEATAGSDKSQLGLEGRETCHCHESAPRVLTVVKGMAEGLPAIVNSNTNCSGSQLSSPTSCLCTTTGSTVSAANSTHTRNAGSQWATAEGTDHIGQPSPCSPLHPEEEGSPHHHVLLVNPMLQQIMVRQQRRYEESVAMLSSSSSVCLRVGSGGRSADAPSDLPLGPLRSEKGDEAHSQKKTIKDPLLRESAEFPGLLSAGNYHPPQGLLLTPKTSLEGIAKGVVAGVLGSAGVAVLERDDLLCHTSSCSSSSDNSSGSHSAEEGEFFDDDGERQFEAKQSKVIDSKVVEDSKERVRITCKKSLMEPPTPETSTGLKDSYPMHYYNPNPPPLRGHVRRTLNSGAGARTHSGGKGKEEEIKGKSFVMGDPSPSLGSCDVTRTRVGLGVDEEAFAQFMNSHEVVSVGAVVPRPHPPPRAPPAKEGVRSSPRHNNFNRDHNESNGPSSRKEQGQLGLQTDRNPNHLSLSARDEGQQGRLMGNQGSRSNNSSPLSGGAGDQGKTLVLIKPRGVLASKQQGGDLGLSVAIKKGEQKANGVANTSSNSNSSLVVVGGTIAKPNGLLFSTPPKGVVITSVASPLPQKRQVGINTQGNASLNKKGDDVSSDTAKTIDDIGGPSPPSSSSSAYIAQQNNWVAFWEKEDARKAKRKRQDQLSIERRLLHATLQQTTEGTNGKENEKKNKLICHPKDIVASEKAAREKVLEALRDFNNTPNAVGVERAKTIEALLATASSPRKFGKLANDSTHTTAQSPLHGEIERSPQSSNDGAIVDVGASNSCQSDKGSGAGGDERSEESTSTTHASPSLKANVSPSLQLPRIVGPSGGGGAITNRFSESTSSTDRVHAVGLLTLTPRPPPSLLTLPSASRRVNSGQPSFLPSLTGVLPPRLIESRENEERQSGGGSPADVDASSGDDSASPRSVLDVQRIAVGDSEAMNSYLRYLDDVLDRLSSGTQNEIQ